MRIDEIFRTEYGRILATLIRVLGDFDVAEDALQEAFAAALERWPAAGLPTNPVAWLIGTARHKAIDRLRRRTRLAYSLRCAARRRADRATRGGVDGRLPGVQRGLRRQLRRSAGAARSV